MSRVRPTREQTRERIVAAALARFERDGIAATSIEDIVAEAGYTRGAFYSSFDSIDDLVLTVIDQHVNESIAELEALTSAHPDPIAFLADLAEQRVTRAKATKRSTRILAVELNLYALRNPANRPRLTERIQKLRAVIGDLVERHFAAAGREPPLPPEQFAAMLIAMDDGIAIHSVLEPGFYGPDTFFRWLNVLIAVTDPETSSTRRT